jgi:4'-phosphopantetheinyl transferase EntD
MFPRDLFSMATARGPSNDALLHQLERELIRNARAERRGEFAAARQCAHRALARFGIEPQPILRDPHGAPQWPHGVCGSITHTSGCMLGVVALDSRVVALGVDVEARGAAFPERALAPVCRPEEFAELHDEASPLRHVNAYAVFCAKEAIYKAVYSATRERLGFQDARVHLDLPRGLFRAHLLRSADGRGRRELIGRVGYNDAHVFAAVWWLRERGPCNRRFPLVTPPAPVREPWGTGDLSYLTDLDHALQSGCAS